MRWMFISFRNVFANTPTMTGLLCFFLNNIARRSDVNGAAYNGVYQEHIVEEEDECNRFPSYILLHGWLAGSEVLCLCRK